MAISPITPKFVLISDYNNIANTNYYNQTTEIHSINISQNNYIANTNILNSNNIFAQLINIGPQNYLYYLSANDIVFLSTENDELINIPYNDSPIKNIEIT